MKLTYSFLASIYIYILSLIGLFIAWWVDAVSTTNLDFPNFLFFGLIILSVISAIISLVFLILIALKSFRLFDNKKIDSLRKTMKTIKLSLIPFFILNFGFYSFIFIIFLAATRGFILFSPYIFILSFPIAFTYIIVLGTSVSGILYIYLNYQKGKMTVKSAILHGFLQLLFLFDMVSTILLLSEKAYIDEQTK